MQKLGFEAALRYLRSGASNQQIIRVLEVAQRLSRCAMVGVFAAADGEQRLLTSLGVPYSATAMRMQSNPAAAALIAKPLIVANLDQHPVLSHHPLSHFPEKLTYLASVPIELPQVPYQLTLACVDSDSSAKRPRDLLRWLATVGDIFRDELSLIGDLALQGERASSNLDIALRAAMDSINSCDWPSALIDSKMTVFAASPAMLRLLRTDKNEIRLKSADSLIPKQYRFVSNFIAEIFGKNSDSKKIKFLSQNKHSFYNVITHKFGIDSVNTEYMLIDVYTEQANREIVSRAASEAAQPEDTSVTSEFLLKTLIRQKRLLRRGKTAYHAIYRWRMSIKETQISALKALKRRPSGGFINAVAGDLAKAATTLFGTSTFGAVTNVACGHSGPRCLAALIAERTAEILGVPYRPAFATLEISGSSHPVTNGKRPRMQVKDAIDCPVLLIDDVATSGSHVDEAARLLKRSAPAVLPLIWIAD